MARTQAADYDLRREAIVEKAAELYAVRGFLGASVSELADACGVSKSAIYHYYNSKEEILFDVMNSHMAALDEAMQTALAHPGDARTRLNLMTHAFMRLYAGAQARHKVLLNDVDQLPPAKRDEIVAIQRSLVLSAERLLTEIEPTLVAPGAGRAAAMLFFGMINWTHTWFKSGGVVSLDMLADMTVDMVLGGLPRVAASA